MAGRGCRMRHPAEMEPRAGSVAPDRFPRRQRARWPEARRRPWPDAEIAFGGEVSFWTPLHIIRSPRQRGRNFEAECLRGLQIEDDLILGRHLHWQVGRLLALED